MKDFLSIIRRNVISPIVIAILILAVALLSLGQSRDALFLSAVIALNTLLAVIQEVRAHRVLRKLELMSAPHAKLVGANGLTRNVMYSELKIGDTVKLELGDEIPADGTLTKNDGLEVNESILTGESAPVEKTIKTSVYAGSAVVAGAAIMRIDAVGDATRIGKMASTLKRYKPELTPLQRSISMAISWLTFGAIGLSILISVVYSLSGYNAVQTFQTIASAAVVIVPEGLLLGSSLLLAYGSLKLAQAKVLPQKLAAIEAMALLDVLCVDKTGTLTDNEIKFEKLEIFKTGENLPTSELVGVVAKETSSNSATGKAVINGVKAPRKYEILETMEFSSSRKMSGIRVGLNGKKYSLIMGAPEYVGRLAALNDEQKRRIDLLTGEGKRVLLAATFGGSVSLKELKQTSGKVVGIVILSNDLREGVQKTVSYLQSKGVSIRVISGDNPNTVKYVACKVGIKNYENIMTGSQLAGIKEKDWDETVANTTIFARVLPEQKERLVDTFRRLGKFTGMVGDGVNDALALKKSDFGVAMYAGSSATRRIADVVLLDNSFNSLPIGMRLGNRVMQSIEIIATLFFNKIIFGLVLILTTLAFGLVYPFQPRHITFMNIFLVTLPTVIWTVFPPSPRQRISPRYFWRDTLWAVAPIAILSGIMITSAYTILHNLHPNDTSGVSTATVIIATFFGIYMVYLVPFMFDIKNTKKAVLVRIVYALTVALVFVLSFGLGFLRDFFDFTMPAGKNVWPIWVMIFCTIILQWIIAIMVGKRIKKRVN